MFDDLNDSVAYRAFDGRPIFVTKGPVGHRLSSGAFKSAEISVYLGSETTLRQVIRKHPGCGVAALPLTRLAKLGIELRRDPRDTPDDLPGHRIFENRSDGTAKRLAKAALIVVRLPNHEVYGAEGTVGVDASLMPAS